MAKKQDPLAGFLNGIGNFFGGIWHGIQDFAGSVFGNEQVQESIKTASAEYIKQKIAGSENTTDTKQDTSTSNDQQNQKGFFDSIPIWVWIVLAVVVLFLVFVVFKKK